MNGLFPQLAEAVVTEHFCIHFGWSCSRAGRGLGRDGIRHRELVLTYARPLELGYEHMSGDPLTNGSSIVLT